jgi:hypothetical protein
MSWSPLFEGIWGTYVPGRAAKRLAAKRAGKLRR